MKRIIDFFFRTARVSKNAVAKVLDGGRVDDLVGVADATAAKKKYSS